ncbi:hypothetical protein Q7P37_006566 [Cladosporium fusiforme]
MKTSMTGAAILATLVTSAVAQKAVRSLAFSVEVINKVTDSSLGHLSMQEKKPNFPDPVYGDVAYDVLFTKKSSDNELFELRDLYNPKGSDAAVYCPRTKFSSECARGVLNVGGGEWEAGNYLVDLKFRYDMEPELGWALNNYNKETGIADFEYSRDGHDYAFYACGETPAEEGDEPSGDLVVKYADEPTPSECQDVRLQVTFQKGLEKLEPIPSDCQFSGCNGK